MSRGLPENETYYVSHGAKTPLRLTAPEAISSKKFSSATDVWSYGCLLYEIWSFGHQPFEDFTETEVNRIKIYITCMLINPRTFLYTQGLTKVREWVPTSSPNWLPSDDH